MTLFAAGAVGVLATLFLFVAIVDPWNVLPLSPPLSREPVSSNARFTMPALARSPQFDSAIIGSSSSRLLRPTELDRLLGGRFANLAMNAATAWEQSQMLALFTRTHPASRTIIIGLDTAWCTEAPERTTGRPFPEWMYGGSAWAGYAHLLNLYAVQEAGSQLWTILGLKRSRYGRDGYTSFVPPEAAYDSARVATAFARWGVPPSIPAIGRQRSLPALPMLATALHALSPATRKLVMFTPSHVSFQGVAGSDYAAMLDSCKAQVTQIAKGVANAIVVDFLIPSAITAQRSSFWDPVHYRAPIADQLAEELAGAVAGQPPSDGRVLTDNSR